MRSVSPFLVLAVEKAADVSACCFPTSSHEMSITIYLTALELVGETT